MFWKSQGPNIGQETSIYVGTASADAFIEVSFGLGLYLVNQDCCSTSSNVGASIYIVMNDSIYIVMNDSTYNTGQQYVCSVSSSHELE